VVLVVDEFHLEILRDHDLIGRWYLADVEVVRDIAERFVLFLGDEEMEFLADDALQFAYDGVTAMQNAWLRAQKKKRRHRKAATDAARRKDESPAPPSKEKEPEPEPARQRGARHTRPAATSELARRLAASAPAGPPQPRGPDPEQWVGPGPEATPELERQPASNGRQSLADRRKKITADAVEPAAAPVDRARPQRRRREQPSESTAAPPWMAPEPSSEEPVVAPHEPVQRPAFTDDRQIGPAEEVRPSRKSRDSKAAPASEPVRARGRGRRLPSDSNGGSSSAVEEVPAAPEPAVDESGEADVRFAAEGHHPAETNTGLLSRLRRQPKKPNDHVHKFQESGSSVGLVRRVCVECSYVSIGSDDDSSSITHW
jgi:hypothetical protein